MKVKPLELPDEIKPEIIKKLVAGSDISICGCWEWKGRKRNGYGTMAVPGKKSSGWTHRLSYAAIVGPIAEDHVIDHRCRNRACWNPSHLIQVIHQKNCKSILARKIRDVQHSLFDFKLEVSIFGVKI